MPFQFLACSFKLRQLFPHSDPQRNSSNQNGVFFNPVGSEWNSEASLVFESAWFLQMLEAAMSIYADAEIFRNL